MYKLPLILSGILLFISATAQKQKGYLPDKPGTWKFDYTILTKTAGEIQFKKNIATLAEWFHQEIPVLAQPKGYNLWAVTTGMWNDHYQLSPANYGMRAEMSFYFHMFISDGSIWKAELPEACYYTFEINNTQGGALNYHGQFPYFDNLKDDPKLEKAINMAASKLDDIKIIFPFKAQLAPGVHVYEEFPGSSRCHIVVFNPDRPSYSTPVTMKELADIYLEYYSLYQKLEIDRMVLQELKNEIAKIPADELNKQAYTGHDSNIVFRFNGQKQGMPLVRFNAEYWDKSLPPSAIQYMTFWYPQMTESEMAEHLGRFGYPVYSQLLVNQINWNEVAGLIMKGN
jgi:hypothetical protein